MATAKKSKSTPLPVLSPGAELIQISEYVRRINEQRLKADPLAPVIYNDKIHNLINTGEFETVKFGRGRFIDWNKYKHWVFRANRTDARKKKGPLTSV